MERLLNPQLVLIDVDGTLVDSVPDLLITVNETMAELGRPEWDEGSVRNWIGNGVERLCRRALVGALEGEPEEALFERAYPFFLAAYDRHNGRRSRLYPGVEQALERLRQMGHRVGCVTNKAARFTLPLLQALGVADHFELILCGDQLEHRKPHPLPLLHAAAHFDADPRRCVMFGDSISDVKAARAAEFGIICMSYGYNHGVDIRSANPDAVVDSMMDAVDLL